MTVRDLYKEAAVMAGSFAIGDPEPPDDEAQYGLSVLNQLVDLWAAERLTVYRRHRQGPFNLVAGTASYTVGSGGTWNMSRPIWIDAAGIVLVNQTPNVELPMGPILTKEWARVPVKTQQSAVPQSYYYEPTFPYGTFYPYPVPSYAHQVVIYAGVPVAEFATLDDVISLPPGYRIALKANLAVMLCFGLREVPGDVATLAAHTLGRLKTANEAAHMDPLTCGEISSALSSGGGQWNFLTGETT